MWRLEVISDSRYGLGEDPGVPDAEVMAEIITRVLELRAKFGTQEGIQLKYMDVESAIRWIGIDLGREAAFVYQLEDLVLLDFRLQFGWRGSPECSSMVVTT